jgi:hypothetical protein
MAMTLHALSLTPRVLTGTAFLYLACFLISIS